MPNNGVRVKKLKLMSVAVLALLLSCTAVQVKTTPEQILGSGATPVAPSTAELSTLVDAISYDQAVLRYGKPLAIDNDHDYLTAEWQLQGRHGAECKFKLSFSSLTTKLLTFQSSCD